MYGIAKKFNQECEAFPMHTHSAIVEMVRVGMQHRNLKLQAEQNAKQAEQQERVLKVQEQQMELQKMAHQREAAAQIRLVSKPEPAKDVALKPLSTDEAPLETAELETVK